VSYFCGRECPGWRMSLAEPAGAMANRVLRRQVLEPQRVRTRIARMEVGGNPPPAVTWTVVVFAGANPNRR